MEELIRQLREILIEAQSHCKNCAGEVFLCDDCEEERIRLNDTIVDIVNLTFSGLDPVKKIIIIGAGIDLDDRSPLDWN